MFPKIDAGLIQESTIQVAFNLSSYLSREEETLPWIAAMSGFNDVLHNFDDQPDSEGIRVEFLENPDLNAYRNLSKLN